MKRKAITIHTKEYTDDEFEAIYTEFKRNLKKNNQSLSEGLIGLMDTKNKENNMKKEENIEKENYKNLLYKLNYLIGLTQLTGLNTANLTIRDHLKTNQEVDNLIKNLNGLNYADYFAKSKTDKDINEKFKEKSKEMYGSFFEESVSNDNGSTYDFDSSIKTPDWLK